MSEGLSKQLENIWLTDKYVYQQLADLILSATVYAPNGQEIPDRAEKLNGIKLRLELRGYKWASLSFTRRLEQLLAGKQQEIAEVLDAVGLTDEVVLRELKNIMDNAFLIIPTKDDYYPAPYNKIRLAAQREYSRLRAFLNDDVMDAFKILKASNRRLELIQQKISISDE